MIVIYQDVTRQVQIDGKAIDLDSAAREYFCQRGHALAVLFVSGKYRLWCHTCGHAMYRVVGKYSPRRNPTGKSEKSASEDIKDLFGKE